MDALALFWISVCNEGKLQPGLLFIQHNDLGGLNVLLRDITFPF